MLVTATPDERKEAAHWALVKAIALMFDEEKLSVAEIADALSYSLMQLEQIIAGQRKRDAP